MTLSDLGDFNRVPAVAKVLTINDRTLYKMVERGDIGHVRLGIGRGGLRITRAQVEAYIAANTHDVAPKPELRLVDEGARRQA